MKTLYELLEVSETASKEIIEKAYRVLAKKYHPDLQPEDRKEIAEKQMKELNEAYSILNDETKRKEYDTKLSIQREVEKEKNNNVRQSNHVHTNAPYYESQNYNGQDAPYQEQTQNQTRKPMTEEEYKAAKRREQEYIKQQQKMQQEIQKNVQAQYEQKYQQAYEDYLRNLGYKIKYKWTWKNYKDLLITILIIIAIGVALWFFPPTHKILIDFYNSNNIIKTIFDIIGSIFIGIWNAICSLFK